MSPIRLICSNSWLTCEWYLLDSVNLPALWPAISCDLDENSIVCPCGVHTNSDSGIDLL